MRDCAVLRDRAVLRGGFGGLGVSYHRLEGVEDRERVCDLLGVRHVLVLVEDTRRHYAHAVFIEHRDDHAGERKVRIQVVVELDERGDRIQRRDTRDPGRRRVRLEHRDVREERVGLVHQLPPRTLHLHQIHDAVAIPILEGRELEAASASPVDLDRGGYEAQREHSTGVGHGQVHGRVALSLHRADFVVRRAQSGETVPDDARDRRGHGSRAGRENELELVTHLVAEQVADHGQQRDSIHAVGLEATVHVDH